MVKIRLMRIGKTNDPHYRIVATHSHRKNSGRPLEILGFWHPRSEDFKIDKKKIKAWEKKGAQVSDAVVKLIEK